MRVAIASICRKLLKDVGVTVAYAQSSSSAANSDDSQVAAKITAGDATVTQVGAAYNFGSIAVGAQYNGISNF